MQVRLLQAVAIGIAALSTAAYGQLYKCKGPDGKIVYSDTRCEAAATTSNMAPGASNRAHAIEEKAAADKAAAEKAATERRLDAEARVAAERKAAGLPPIAPGAAPAAPPASPAAAGVPGRYQLTASDRERIGNLEVDAGRAGASAERKSAALLEISSIRSGRDAQMPGDARARRDALAADLSSADAKKRKQALDELRALYSSY